MDFEQLKEEAKRRGIVEGAVIKCPGLKCEHTVGPTDTLSLQANGDLWNRPNEGLLKCDGKWAEVIKPAPTQDTDVGLIHGDAVECGPKMRVAIVELADELGLNVSPGCDGNPTYGSGMHFRDGKINSHESVWPGVRRLTNHTTEAFIAKMRAEAAKSKPKELTLEVARELLTEAFRTIEVPANRELLTKLAEYGIS